MIQALRKSRTSARSVSPQAPWKVTFAGRKNPLPNLFVPIELAAAVETAIHKSFSRARLESTVQRPNGESSPAQATLVTEWFVAPPLN